MTAPDMKKWQLYNDIAPCFAKLGGGQPDAAVAACAAVSLYVEGFSPLDVVLAPDVLAAALGMLCAPLIVTHARDLEGREAQFCCPAVSVRLRSTDEETVGRLSMINDQSDGQLSVVVGLDEDTLPEAFLKNFQNLRRLDLRNTAVQRVGKNFAHRSWSLTSIALPDTATEIGDYFLSGCEAIEAVQLANTAVRRVGADFASVCTSLTCVALPNTVTVLGDSFLSDCYALEQLDLRNTAILRVSDCFAAYCRNLTSVLLPDNVTEIESLFLVECVALRQFDLRNTAIRSV